MEFVEEEKLDHVEKLEKDMIENITLEIEENSIKEVPKKQFFQGNLDSPHSACIVIASHLSKENRVGYLIECLTSLMAQTLVIPIYLSISFENDEINRAFAIAFSQNQQLHNDFIYLYPQEQKTPQMRHISMLYPILKERYHWIMFCDDDDTYHEKRVETLLNNIDYCMKTIVEPNIFDGIYEQQHDADHRQRRHEYWCYCVNARILGNFLKVVEGYPDVLDNKCCDVLFAEYIRRLGAEHIFGCMKDKFYNYRVDDNEDSITGFIQKNNKSVRPSRQVTGENADECAIELNAYLDDNLSFYLHDTFLYSIVGQSFDEILKSEFKSEYAIVDKIRHEYVGQMQDLHGHLREVSNLLYHIKI